MGKREIKFRGKAFSDGKWRELTICPCSENTLKIISVYDEEEIIDMNTIGQYTGLTDKNGKEIYEGDIVHYKGNLGKSIAEIKYKDDRFIIDWIVNKEFANDILRNWANEIEVIGNIYENPDLLTK